MRKGDLIKAKYTSEANATLYVLLPVLSRGQAERTQGLYKDTTVALLISLRCINLLWFYTKLVIEFVFIHMFSDML